MTPSTITIQIAKDKDFNPSSILIDINKEFDHTKTVDTQIRIEAEKLVLSTIEVFGRAKYYVEQSGESRWSDIRRFSFTGSHDSFGFYIEKANNFGTNQIKLCDINGANLNKDVKNSPVFTKIRDVTDENGNEMVEIPNIWIKYLRNGIPGSHSAGKVTYLVSTYQVDDTWVVHPAFRSKVINDKYTIYRYLRIGKYPNGVDSNHPGKFTISKDSTVSKGLNKDQVASMMYQMGGNAIFYHLLNNTEVGLLRLLTIFYTLRGDSIRYLKDTLKKDDIFGIKGLINTGDLHLVDEFKYRGSEFPKKLSTFVNGKVRSIDFDVPNGMEVKPYLWKKLLHEDTSIGETNLSRNESSVILPTSITDQLGDNNEIIIPGTFTMDKNTDPVDRLIYLDLSPVTVKLKYHKLRKIVTELDMVGGHGRFHSCRKFKNHSVPYTYNIYYSSKENYLKCSQRYGSGRCRVNGGNCIFPDAFVMYCYVEEVRKASLNLNDCTAIKVHDGNNICPHGSSYNNECLIGSCRATFTTHIINGHYITNPWCPVVHHYEDTDKEGPNVEYTYSEEDITLPGSIFSFRAVLEDDVPLNSITRSSYLVK